MMINVFFQTKIHVLYVKTGSYRTNKINVLCLIFSPMTAKKTSSKSPMIISLRVIITEFGYFCSNLKFTVKTATIKVNNTSIKKVLVINWWKNNPSVWFTHSINLTISFVNSARMAKSMSPTRIVKRLLKLKLNVSFMTLRKIVPDVKLDTSWYQWA